MLKLFKKGKVRNVYELSGNRLLIVATNRVSAFDAVMPQTIPGKGKVLNQLSAFWFQFIKEKRIAETHFISAAARSMTVKKAIPIPLEFIVRGYLYGSAWKEYQEGNWMSCVWKRLKLASKLPQPVVSLTTKAESGRDQPLEYQRAKLFFADWAKQKGIKSVVNPWYFFDSLVLKSLEIYNKAQDYAQSRDIIIADTKFEFGFDVADDKLMLIDEVFTPDSSRFWPKEEWRPGHFQQSHDKQLLRDWLESAGWDKNSPPPDLSEEIIQEISKRYKEIFAILTA